MMQYNFYYNNTPEFGPTRNNLIYTSLLSEDEKVFCQWYHNDSDYHKGQNTVDPALLEQKFKREVEFLTLMQRTFPALVPNVLDINLNERKIYLEVDGPDFWERAACTTANYDSVIPDWQEQMLEIVKAHHSLGLYKYSMHPSSYWVINGRLKSINYFFTYHRAEGPISIKDHQSHLSINRQAILREQVEKRGISWDTPQPLPLLESVCWDSFSSNYPAEFIEKVKCIN